MIHRYREFMVPWDGTNFVQGECAPKRYRCEWRTEAACVREDIARRLSKIDQSIITNGAIFESWPQNPKRLQVKSSHPARISEQAFT